MKMNGTQLYQKELFEKHTQDIVLHIVNKLSNNYKQCLKKYFSEEGLFTYIVEKVEMKFQADILQNNLAKLGIFDSVDININSVNSIKEQAKKIQKENQIDLKN